MRKLFSSLLITIAIVSLSCSSKKTDDVTDSSTPIAKDSSRMKIEPFGKLPDGREVSQYTLKNKNGVEMKVINYGGIIRSLKVPDKAGVLEDIVLGYDSLSDYLKDSPYFGSIIGRYGNRIANGKFKIDDKEYTVAKNNNGQHLHGGLKGFDKVYWEIKEAESDDGPAIELRYVSKDMEEGYPGNLSVAIVYTLTEDNNLKIDYTATTDKKTVLNLTQHTYFNLSGNVKRDILDHLLMLKADQYVPVKASLIPTGKLEDVKGTPFDFNIATRIGKRINNDHPQLKFAKGYDHCFVLSSQDSVKLVGSLYDSISGRLMQVYTTEPGVQFYTGNFLDGSNIGKSDVVYKQRYGLCLETQHFPDSPNQPNFPEVILNPGETYRTQTSYRFSTD